uniref:Uncharacterized protein n=1 Tax=Octopus bimaculoides TaxID=37653 RepID=A0A0L8I3E1_OCTBM
MFKSDERRYDPMVVPYSVRSSFVIVILELPSLVNTNATELDIYTKINVYIYVPKHKVKYQITDFMKTLKN